MLGVAFLYGPGLQLKAAGLDASAQHQSKFAYYGVIAVFFPLEQALTILSKQKKVKMPEQLELCVSDDRRMQQR